jgi:hypothetical protein
MKKNDFQKKKNEPVKKVVVNVKPEIQPTPVLKPKRPSRKKEAKVEEKVEEKIVEKSRPLPRKEKPAAFVEAFTPEAKVEEKNEEVIDPILVALEKENENEEESVSSFSIWDGAKYSLITLGLIVSYIIGYFVGTSYCLG